MQLVHDRYYIWYNRVVTTLGGVLVIGSLAAIALPRFAMLTTDWGLTPLALGLGLMQVGYGILLFNKVGKSNSYLVAALVSTMLFILSLVNLLNTTGQLHSPYMAVWFVLTLVSGMFGLYTAVAGCFLVTIVFILQGTTMSGTLQLDQISLAAVLVTYVLCTISYFAWKRAFVDHESQRVSQLTGQLKSNQQQAEILIQQISDGVIVTDNQGKISLVNPAAATMTGWPVEEALGIDAQLVTKFVQEDGKEIPAEQLPFKQALEEHKPIDRILQLLDRSGQQHRIVSLVISPIVLPKTNEIVGTAAVFRDVSVSREEEHRRADFISTASHEMRTPVAAIEGYLALALNEKVSKIDAKARQYLVKAHESTQHLGKLFQDLLTSAKAEDGRLVNHPEVVELGAYLEQITEGLKFAAEKKGLLMDFTIGTSDAASAASSVGGGKVVKPLYYAHIDPDRMREVITNLFDNAVKYTESGKVSIGLTGNDDVIQFFIREIGREHRRHWQYILYQPATTQQPKSR
jgi:PAS domain S-box-containing protein